VASTIFKIIGIVSIVACTLVGILALPFLARFLKKVNESIADRSRQIRDQVSTSLNEIETAQTQIETIATTTSSIKAGMNSCLTTADKAVSFLESRIFQTGVPAALWLLLIAIALPRGLRKSKSKKKARRVIPPPSWDDAAHVE